MRNAAYLCVGLLLILLQGNLYRVLGLLEPPVDADLWRRMLGIFSATPNLVLPLIIFLGVQENSVARGVTISFALGHLTDLLAGAPLFLFTFMSVSMWGLAKVAGFRFSAQTPLTRIPLVVGFCLVEGAIVLTLLAIFGPDNRTPVELLAFVLPRAFMTALLSPVVFGVAQRIVQSTAAPRGAEATGAIG